MTANWLVRHGGTNVAGCSVGKIGNIKVRLECRDILHILQDGRCKRVLGLGALESLAILLSGLLPLVVILLCLVSYTGLAFGTLSLLGRRF
jgi:hypothetical protein